MYDSVYGFREKPFSLVPDPELLYLSRRHRAALRMLESALTDRAGISVLTGEAGSGKTTVVRRFLNSLDTETTVGLITNTHPDAGDLLKWILFAFGVGYNGKSRIEQYDRLVAFLIEQSTADRQTVLIIDEAQNLDSARLEELRVLSNAYDGNGHLLQIILIGQPELVDKLDGPDMKQMAQRIAVNFRLGSLSFSETTAYIRHRLKAAGGQPDIFDATACGGVYYFSRGVPRLINMVCDAALNYGSAKERTRLDIDAILNAVEDRRQSGLAVFASVGQPLERAKILAEVEGMKFASLAEEEPPESSSARQTDIPGPENELACVQDDPPGPVITLDSPRAEDGPQGSAAQHRLDPEAAPNRPLDLSPMDPPADADPRSWRGRFATIAFLAVAAVVGIAVVSMLASLSDRQPISEQSDDPQAAPARALDEADTMSVPDAPPVPAAAAAGSRQDREAGSESRDPRTPNAIDALSLDLEYLESSMIPTVFD